MLYRHLLSAAVVLATALAPLALAAQTTGPCSDDGAGNGRSSPVVLHFAPDQSVLQNDDAKKLAQLARLARSHNIQEICVQGFTAQSTPEATQQLSLARGRAVADQLSRNGVDPRTIVIDPHGERATSVAGVLDEATGSDRRLEVRFSRY